MESDPGLEEEPSTYPYQAPSVALFRRICLFLHEYPAVWVFGGLYLLYLVRTHLPKLKKAWQHRAEARKEKLPKPKRPVPGLTPAAVAAEGTTRDAQRLAWLERQQEKYLEEARIKAAAAKEKQEKEKEEAKRRAVQAGEEQSKKKQEEPRNEFRGGGVNPLLSGSASMVGGFRSSRSGGGRGRGG
mmetsp:Transcript_20320/g.56621  ORF Transcript_20320/g.56621 Transcript_20320/m.56621 type:complete len:186 (+) Transcript_20320:72-629(+)